MELRHATITKQFPAPSRGDESFPRTQSSDTDDECRKWAAQGAKCSSSRANPHTPGWPAKSHPFTGRSDLVGTPRASIHQLPFDTEVQLEPHGLTVIVHPFTPR